MNKTIRSSAAMSAMLVLLSLAAAGAQAQQPFADVVVESLVFHELGLFL